MIKTALIVAATLVTTMAQAKIHYVRSGHGPGLVLLHSLATSHADWDAEVARLQKTHTVIAVDMPGHGGSPAPARVELDAIAREVAEIARKEKVTPAVFIGHSMGGTIVGHVPLVDAAAARAIVIVDSIIGPLPAPADERKQLRADLARDHDGTLRKFYAPICLPTQIDRIMATAHSMAGATWVDYLDAAATQPVADGGRAIKVPLLLMTSNDLVPDASKEKQVLVDAGFANVADLTVVHFDTLHWIQWEQPQKFATVLDSFLARVEKK